MNPSAGLMSLVGQDEDEVHRLREQITVLEERVRAADRRRTAMLHIMDDLTDKNRRLNNQRRAMIHILADYEQDRKDLARQTERLNNSRRALMHILQDAHESNVRLGLSRKAMIHIMDDLRETTEEMKQRENELREKQEQLVQTAKLATLGELTTGLAHELNNPLNNIGLYIGNVLDLLEMGSVDEVRIKQALGRAMQQVQKATEIITHLRTFGRASPSSRHSVRLNEVIESATSLLREQLRLRQIVLETELAPENPAVSGNFVQLEQVLMNLLTNARDAVANFVDKRIRVASQKDGSSARIIVEDSGPGIPGEMQEKIFDPFFTTKDVGEGTGLGLSIVYGIVHDHSGSISVQSDGRGARFVVELPVEMEPA